MAASSTRQILPRWSAATTAHPPAALTARVHNTGQPNHAGRFLRQPRYLDLGKHPHAVLEQERWAFLSYIIG